MSWSTTPGPRCPEILNRETPQAAGITSANPTPTVYYNYQVASNRPHLSTAPTWGPGTQSTSTPFQVNPTPTIYYNCQAASNRPQLSTAPTWGLGTQSTSTPFQISPTPSRRTMQTPSSGEPVDTFINRLKECHETVFETSCNDSRLDSSMALLRAQERDYYYRVKACTTWCVKMGQSAILQTPEYLSRATMRLPMNLRVKWYEHIDSRSDRATLTEFEKWLCKRVDTLFNPLEDFIYEERNKMQRSTARPKSSVRLHPLATTTDRLSDVPQNCSDKPVQVQSRKRESRNNVQSNEHKCFVCLNNNHRVAFCPVFKSKPVKERRKIAWDSELCFNCLKANHQSRDCLSTNRCLRCGQTHHTLLHEDCQPDPSTDSASSTLKGRTQSSAPPNADSRYLEPSTTPVPVATCTSDVQTSVNRVSVQPQRKVLLQVLPVQIHSQRGLVNTYAVLDPGSDSTLIRKDIADSLQLRGEPHQLNLCTVGSDPTTQNMCRVSFCLSSNNHPEPVPVNGAWVINKLNIPSVKLSKNDAVERWCHLSDVDIPELEGCDVTLLIGSIWPTY